MPFDGLDGIRLGLHAVGVRGLPARLVAAMSVNTLNLPELRPAADYVFVDGLCGMRAPAPGAFAHPTDNCIDQFTSYIKCEEKNRNGESVFQKSRDR